MLTTTIDIDAAAPEVWAVLTDFASYGEWSNFSRVEGTPQEGTKLSIRMPGLSFKPTITAAIPCQELEWAAKVITERLFVGRHTFTLAPQGDASTRLTNTETFEGASVAPFRRFFANNHKDSGYDAFNRALKARVEQRAS